jgi:hypothetical protein
VCAGPHAIESSMTALARSNDEDQDRRELSISRLISAGPCGCKGCRARHDSSPIRPFLRPRRSAVEQRGSMSSCVGRRRSAADWSAGALTLPNSRVSTTVARSAPSLRSRDVTRGASMFGTPGRRRRTSFSRMTHAKRSGAHAASLGPQHVALAPRAWKSTESPGLPARHEHSVDARAPCGTRAPLAS